MGRTIISSDGRFEWDIDKSRQNRKKHGFSFDEILDVFDDPAFLEGYNYEHSEHEDRYYGIGCIDNILYIIVFYTYRDKKPTDPGELYTAEDNSAGKSLPLGAGPKGTTVSESGPEYQVERKRLISARRADKDEQEQYNDLFK
jgi:uncharacterized DUF497 family protein